MPLASLRRFVKDRPTETDGTRGKQGIDNSVNRKEREKRELIGFFFLFSLFSYTVRCRVRATLKPKYVTKKAKALISKLTIRK